MKKVITQRTGQDDFHAHLIAQGMEDAGADVFAITNDRDGYVQVYCKHDRSLSADNIDKAISKALETKAECYLSI